jgi:small subunit ribosomal protein S20
LHSEFRRWPVRLSARTPGFHPGKRGSIPLRATIYYNKEKQMANHKSALKRIRSNETKRLRNKYQHKTTRNAIKKLRDMEKKKDAEKLFPTVTGMIDKLAKNNIIHANKAANLKSGLAKHIATLK